MKRSASKFLLCAAAVLLLTGRAHAVTFTGTATGSWSDVVSAYSTDVFSIANNDTGGAATFNWGVPATTPFDNQFLFNGVGSDGGAWVADSEDPFLVGDFQYRNGSTYNSEGINGVSLDISLAISDPLSNTSVYDFNFFITNTPNNTGDPVADGDIVTVASSFSPTTFTYGGTDYTLELLGFSSDGGMTIRTDFSSPEGAPAGAGVYARITSEIPNAVPEPSTLLLLGLGLPGVAALSRRRRR